MTKSPGFNFPDFLACPGSMGPPSTNRTTLHPYFGSSLIGSSCKPTGPGENTIILSREDLFGLLVARDVDFKPFGVRRTLTSFLALDRCELGVPRLFTDSFVPNFLTDGLGGYSG